VVIAGGNSGVALRLARSLTTRGDEVVALIRNPDRREVVRRQGAMPVLCDVASPSGEVVSHLAGHLAGADAVVFTAGTGVRSPENHAPAVVLADAIEKAHVRRYLLLSTITVDRVDQHGMDPELAGYLRAKSDAEEDLRRRDLDWTILRAGRLTDEPGTGCVRLGCSVPPGEVTRDDVASVLRALLEEPASVGKRLEVVAGDTPIATAVAHMRVVGGP
jgi:uncharacterized protein YbjT (DUF2867 family)